VEQCTQFDVVLRSNMREVHESVLALAGEFDIGDVLPSAALHFLRAVRREPERCRGRMTLYSALSTTVCQPSVDPHGRNGENEKKCVRATFC